VSKLIDKKGIKKP